MDLLKEIEKNNYTVEYSKNGARCYQNLKVIVNIQKNQIFAGKYLHKVCVGLNAEDLKCFEAELKIKLNKDLLDFYKRYNGFHLFSGAFDIFGFGRIFEDGYYLVSRESDICLPYHLFDENDGIINEEKFKIGVICYKPLYYDNKTGVVTLDKGEEVERWKNLDECIEDVYHRLYVQYLPNGVIKKQRIEDEFIFNTPENL